jgi:glutamate racemase
VEAQACPLFVPIVEEGLNDHEVAGVMAREYCRPFRGSGADVVILGCTHYPLLAEALGAALGPGVRLIDSAAPTAGALAALLSAHGMESRDPDPRPPRLRLCVTDASYSFLRVASVILDSELAGRVEQVSVEAPGEGGSLDWQPPLLSASLVSASAPGRSVSPVDS